MVERRWRVSRLAIASDGRRVGRDGVWRAAMISSAAARRMSLVDAMGMRTWVGIQVRVSTIRSALVSVDQTR
jgi:hypothetical protein